MPIIHINVKEKIAKGNKDEFIVCNNSDYEILFDFDEEWQEYNHKTAIVTLSNREFVPILFDGNKCKLPPLQNATFCKIGVMASLENDDATIRISTTTPASINCLESAYDENGEILPPTDDIYQQILAKLNDINTNISRGGTSVTVGGVEQKTWNADSKLDKYTEASGAIRYYGVDDNGNQVVGYIMKHPTYQMNPGYLATYFHKNEAGDEIGGTRAVLLTDTPEKPYHCANKIYVDDGLSGKLDKVTTTGQDKAYMCDSNGNQTTKVISSPYYIFSYSTIPVYCNATDTPNNVTDNPMLLISPATPTKPYHAANKKYVDEGLNNKVDKVTTKFKIYGTDGSGNQKVYPTGWSASSGLFQIMDGTPNGGYNDDGSFNSNTNGTYMVAIPKKPSHATPKKWVEDNFTVYKHIVSFRVYDNMFIDGKFIVYSSQATPFTTTLPNGVYAGWCDDGYNFLISNRNGNIIATKLFGDVQNIRYLLDDDLFVDSDTVTKL